jgi:transcriptional regulator of acetoin/glycerol metabolism
MVVATRRLGWPSGPGIRRRHDMRASSWHMATQLAPTTGSRFEAAQNAIRDYQRPSQLAQSPLAVGPTPRERIANLRGLVDRAIDDAFGESHCEQALREVLVAAYVQPNNGHENAAYELNISRSTYFRKLRVALERVAGQLAQ